MKLVGIPLMLAASACVIPPSLSVGAEDAAVNSPPAILSVRIDGQELVPPGPVNFFVADAPTMTADVVDTDLGDTLYVSVFVDYQIPGNELAPRSSCQAPPSATNPSAQRTATCDLRSVCVATDASDTPPGAPFGPLPGVHEMSVVVFDRDPDGGGAPAFQVMQGSGGLSTSLFFVEECHPLQ